MTRGPFRVERKVWAGHPYIAITDETDNNVISLELDDALDIHAQLGDVLGCNDDNCPCWDAGYRDARGNPQ